MLGKWGELGVRKGGRGGTPIEPERIFEEGLRI